MTRNPIQPGDGDPRHGTSGGYTNHGCRCVQCLEAKRIAQARRHSVRYAQEKNPNDPRHGLESFYGDHGCRCRLCTDAWNAASRRRRARA